MNKKEIDEIFDARKYLLNVGSNIVTPPTGDIHTNGEMLLLMLQGMTIESLRKLHVAIDPKVLWGPPKKKRTRKKK